MSSEPITKIYDYILYFGSFITSQALSMWGQYFTLKFKNLTSWEALKMALPFAWVDWIFLTFAIDLGHTKELVTPTQDTFLLIITQFCLVNLINYFYLKQKIYFSDFVAFFLIILAYYISFFNSISKLFKISLPEIANKESDPVGQTDEIERERQENEPVGIEGEEERSEKKIE